MLSDIIIDFHQVNLVRVKGIQIEYDRRYYLKRRHLYHKKYIIEGTSQTQNQYSSMAISLFGTALHYVRMCEGRVFHDNDRIF